MSVFYNIAHITFSQSCIELAFENNVRGISCLVSIQFVDKLLLEPSFSVHTAVWCQSPLTHLAETVICLPTVIISPHYCQLLPFATHNTKSSKKSNKVFEAKSFNFLPISKWRHKYILL